jgi:DNA modification methylase
VLIILKSDARTIPLLSESVDCIVTSPPYWGLRDYGVAGQIGLERTPEEYVETMRAVFRECWRVLKPRGTCWLNLGDSYAGGGRGGYGNGTEKQHINKGSLIAAPKWSAILHLKAKDLVGIPWRVAFALQADGWWLRSDIIWAKPNPMPESVRDRPTRAHEYLFLLAKAERYWYDARAIAEPFQYGDHPRNGAPGPPIQAPGQPAQSGITKRRRSGNKERILGPGRCRPDSHIGASIPWEDRSGLRNARSVWTVATQPYSGSHFATFPEALVRPCILVGCPMGGIVLDPFGGSGTVGKVAVENGRRAVLADLTYHELARKRTAELTPALPLEVA